MDCGRNKRFDASCSRQCAVHPATRPQANAGAEAHETLAALESPPQDALRPIGALDLEDKFERRSWRAAMQRPLQRADRAGDRGDHVRLGRDNDPGGEGRCIETVIDDRVPVCVQRLNECGRRLRAAEHAEEVRCVREVFARFHGFEAM